MLQKSKKRLISRSISISIELWEQIADACDGNISISSFIKMAVKKELEKRKK